MSEMRTIIGTRLGPYEILSSIGAGGMGEVYRARDSKLDRDVAIKVLPESFAVDADRVARFTREAKTLAALNHPNIAQIYGLEETAAVGSSQASRALVMELIDGEDLSSIIARGPIAIADALPIARQIADALEAAHEQGIIHRDLKPANIKIRPDGVVKVLDFGLAKALDPTAASGGVMNSPTMTARATQMGMIIGTAAYMAPEQAKGRAVDRRADIWAFGAVLFEMLTGRRVFEGDDITEVLASVIKSDPDWSHVPTNLPAPIRRLLRRCLEKDPRARLSSIGDARLELDEKEPAPAATAVATAPLPARPTWLARLWPVAAAIVVTALAMFALAPKPDAGVETRTSILAPPSTEIYPDSVQVALSPDGTMVAFVSGSIQGTTALWVRQVNSLSAVQLAGTENANLPFWSPDSQRIGFFTPGKLRTVAATGGVVQTVCDSPSNGGRGATWNASNVIVFARDASGPLWKVSATGGEPEPVTTLDPGKQASHRFPTFLPDGDHFLYAALPGRAGKFDIFVGSLSAKTTTLIGQLEGAPVYAEPGYLLFPRQNVLAAQRFDARSFKLIGDSISLADQPTSIFDPAVSFTSGRVVSASSTGTLAYYSAPAANTIPTWVDLTGKVIGTVKVPDGQYTGVTISPDGTRAVVVRSTSVNESSLWLLDLAHGGAVPLSTGHGRNDSPVWSIDGKRVVFASDRNGPQDFYIKEVDDAAPEAPFFQSPTLFKNPEAWTRDGQWLLFQSLDADSAQNLYLLAADGKGDPQPYIRGPQRDFLSTQSPDGRWVSYTSDETGRFEIYVNSFPTPGQKEQVSVEGGLNSRWSPDGKHLLFVGTDTTSLWRADVVAGPGLAFSKPVRLASLPPNATNGTIAPDGQRVLSLVPEQTAPGSITIVRHWLHK